MASDGFRVAWPISSFPFNQQNHHDLRGTEKAQDKYSGISNLYQTFTLSTIIYLLLLHSTLNGAIKTRGNIQISRLSFCRINVFFSPQVIEFPNSQHNRIKKTPNTRCWKHMHGITQEKTMPLTHCALPLVFHLFPPIWHGRSRWSRLSWWKRCTPLLFL